MSATTVTPISSASAEPEPSPARAMLDLRLWYPQHQQQQQPVASATTPKSQRPFKPPPQKKQPLRGLGVAQLERLRLQESWKKLMEVPGTQLQQHPCPMTGPQAVLHFQADVAEGGTRHPPPFQYPVAEGIGSGVLPQCETGVRCLPPGVFGLGRGFVVGNPLSGGWDGVNNGASRELSSMPNARDLVPDHTDHNIHLAVGMNGKLKHMVGGLVMEYEFFPEKMCMDNWNEAQCMTTVGGETTYDSAAAAAEASNSIDLSLKL